jgi:hypothetical protein
LTLSAQSGAHGSSITATYTTDANGCPDGIVHYWWDAAGPSAGNPSGARKLGQAPLDGTCMAEDAGLRVPPTATCEPHTVYAFIADSNGTPQAGTTASVRFLVTGCESPISSSVPPSAASTPPPGAATGGSPGDAGPGTAEIVGIVAAAVALAVVAAAAYLTQRRRSAR